MTSTEKQLNQQLTDPDHLNIHKNNSYQTVADTQGLQLKRPMTIPSINISSLSLVFLCPLLFCAHFLVAELSQIPSIEFIFVSLFISFAVNYIFLVRKYEIPTFLQNKNQDDSLKIAALLTLIAIISMQIWGWTPIGGLISAFVWELFKGKKIQKFFFLYLIIGGGFLMMEKHFTLMTLAELVPGLLLGVSNSIIFGSKQASTYTVTHQLLFFISICIPIVFPTTQLIVPNLYQWAVMMVAGLSVYFTVLCTVKLMQKERVSIVMTIFSAIFVLATSSYWGSRDFVGAILVLVGVIFVVKKQFLDLDF